jgi:hypothetical protein
MLVGRWVMFIIVRNLWHESIHFKAFNVMWPCNVKKYFHIHEWRQHGELVEMLLCRRKEIHGNCKVCGDLLHSLIAFD